MSLKIGDTNDKKNLWARKSRAFAARITMSASSAQKTVDNGTGVVVVVMGTSDDMVKWAAGEISSGGVRWGLWLDVEIWKMR